MGVNRKVFVIETPGVEGNKLNLKRGRCEHNFHPVYYKTQYNHNHIKCSLCGSSIIKK